MRRGRCNIGQDAQCCGRFMTRHLSALVSIFRLRGLGRCRVFARRDVQKDTAGRRDSGGQAIAARREDLWLSLRSQGDLAFAHLDALRFPAGDADDEAGAAYLELGVGKGEKKALAGAGVAPMKPPRHGSSSFEPFRLPLCSRASVLGLKMRKTVDWSRRPLAARWRAVAEITKERYFGPPKPLLMTAAARGDHQEESVVVEPLVGVRRRTFARLPGARERGTGRRSDGG